MAADLSGAAILTSHGRARAPGPGCREGNSLYGVHTTPYLDPEVYIRGTSCSPPTFLDLDFYSMPDQVDGYQIRGEVSTEYGVCTK